MGAGVRILYLPQTNSEAQVKEIKWNDELPERYNSCHGVHPYYGHIKNQENLVYICDKEEYFSLHDNIAGVLKEAEKMTKEYEDKGYEYYYSDLKVDRSNDGGRDDVYFELEFYRKETEEEKQIRIDDVKKDIAKRLEYLKTEAENVQKSLEELRQKLTNKA